MDKRLSLEAGARRQRGFSAGTGICHTFLNNTEQEVRLLVVGEANKKYNRIYYPLNPGYAATRQIVGLTIRRSSSVHTTASRGKVIISGEGEARRTMRLWCIFML